MSTSNSKSTTNKTAASKTAPKTTSKTTRKAKAKTKAPKVEEKEPEVPAPTYGEIISMQGLTPEGLENFNGQVPFVIMLGAGEANVRGEGTFLIQSEKDLTDPVQITNFDSIRTSGVMQPLVGVFSELPEHIALLTPEAQQIAVNTFGKAVAFLVFSGNFRLKAVELLAKKGKYPTTEEPLAIMLPARAFADTPENRIREGFFGNNVADMKPVDKVRAITMAQKALAASTGKPVDKLTNKEVAHFMGMSEVAYGQFQKSLTFGEEVFDVLGTLVTQDTLVKVARAFPGAEKAALKRITRQYNALTAEERTIAKRRNGAALRTNEALAMAGVELTPKQAQAATKVFTSIQPIIKGGEDQTDPKTETEQQPTSSLLTPTVGPKNRVPRSTSAEMFHLIYELAERGVINEAQARAINKGLGSIVSPSSPGYPVALLQALEEFYGADSEKVQSDQDRGFSLPINDQASKYCKKVYGELYESTKVAVEETETETSEEE